MGKKTDFLKVGANAQRQSLSIDNPVHTNFGQKENTNRHNNFGLQDRCSFEFATLGSLSQNTIHSTVLSSISVLNHISVPHESFSFSHTRPASKRKGRESSRLPGPVRGAWLGLLPASAASGQQAAPPPPPCPAPSLFPPITIASRSGFPPLYLPLTTDQQSAGGETDLLATARSRSHTVSLRHAQCADV